jgi:hypothetical protein
MFHFTCFNVEDPHDPSVGLVHGELAIPGNLLRREVFDPVVFQVCIRYTYVTRQYFYKFVVRFSISLKGSAGGSIKELTLFFSWEVLRGVNICSEEWKCVTFLKKKKYVKPCTTSPQEQFGSRIKVIARPSDADTATARGAAQYGLARRPLVSSVIAPRSYLMKVCSHMRLKYSITQSRY